jgi:uroporphyrinogen decarboxylase
VRSEPPPHCPMNSKERMVAALERRKPDRLPVTTHHVMPYFLNQRLNGISADEFFERFGLDAIRWFMAFQPDTAKGEYFDPNHVPGYLEARRVVSDSWRIETEAVPHDEYPTTRYRFVTPRKTLSTVLQSNDYTCWVTERLVKEKSDIEVIATWATQPKCDVAAVNREAAAFGGRGLVRGFINFFDVYGQSGCWQDAAVLYGIEDLILATFDDPQWVHEFLQVLCARKQVFVESLKGARYDVIEHGGGDASSTVISPRIFDEFVAPYDAPLTAAAHAAGQRVVYHTCGGMMPILERIADLGVDAMETFTPRGMGGDTDLEEAKRRIGGRVCMIGGFDQLHSFTGCTEAETKQEVRRCFESAGQGGGFMLSPSDHFFDAELKLLDSFADEARLCVY